MQVPIYIVDAFTDQPFSGNPAAVCLLDGPASEGWMRWVAAEMNLSETAFLHPEDEGWRLRWFTPRVEVDLCGHATLASAHVLATRSGVPVRDPPLRFHTRSGLLEASESDRLISLDFPSLPAGPADPPETLLAALAADGPAPRPEATGYNGTDWLIQLPDEGAVRALSPDFRALGAENCRGIIVTAPAGARTRAEQPEADFVSRFFGPAVGVDEDPVTGSAHCALGPWWAKRFGKDWVTGRQVSARGGTVRVHCRGPRVTLQGRAVTVLEGRIVADDRPREPRR